jgi:hypothetical protein
MNKFQKQFTINGVTASYNTTAKFKKWLQKSTALLLAQTQL